MNAYTPEKDLIKSNSSDTDHHGLSYSLGWVELKDTFLYFSIISHKSINYPNLFKAILKIQTYLEKVEICL